jgi:hypothetical protein
LLLPPLLLVVVLLLLPLLLLPLLLLLLVRDADGGEMLLPLANKRPTKRRELFNIWQNEEQRANWLCCSSRDNFCKVGILVWS